MAQLKLGKLLDRAPVKITINISPDSRRVLDDYAALYQEVYGEHQSVTKTHPRNAGDLASE